MERTFNRCREVERTFCIVTLQSHSWGTLIIIFGAVIICKFSASVAEKNPTPESYFLELSNNFWVKKYLNSL
jgi:hypothetical protein